MNILRIIAYILVLIGAINWALVGIFGFDLVAAILGEMSFMARTIYILVGISALITLITNKDTFNNN